MVNLPKKWLFFIAFLLILAPRMHAQVCENLCLDFDGAGDYVSHALITPLGNANFSAEMWFRTNGNTCPLGSKDIISLTNNAPLSPIRVELKECNGALSVLWYDNAVHGPFPITSSTVNDNQWRHLAMVRQGNNLLVYLQCVLVFQASAIGETVGTLNLNNINLATDNAALDTWAGQQDEVRLWNTVRTTTELCETKDCSISGTLPSGLALYWTFDHDGAVGEGDNSSTGLNITQITDATSNNNHASPSNFTLYGPTSNYVCAQITPTYVLIVTDLPTQSVQQSTICSGTPVHFCILQNHVPATAGPGTTIAWEYWDGSAWSPVTNPDFAGFCFPVSPGSLVCSGSPTGYDEYVFRAVIKKTMAGQVCNYFPHEKKLRVCCQLSGGAVSVNVLPASALNGTLCEGDSVGLDVSLTGVAGIGTDTDIKWSLNGTALTAFDNMTAFNYPINPVGVNDLCFTATLTNCACSPLTLTKCVPVDPTPVCGLITEYPTGTLQLMSIDPVTHHEYYQICPGNDAALQMVNQADFANGNTFWQFKLPGGSWTDLGGSNTLQNTNILPCLKPTGSPYLWNGATCITYRVENRPESMPSGCDPCYSNEVTICLQTAPVADFITGDPQICKGDVSLLSVSAPVAGLNYYWFCNGLYVGSGPTYLADKTANYWVEISNGCQTTVSPWFHLDVCEVIAAISCPLSPNQCACLGEEITLSGCVPTYSKDTCPGIYSYVWTASNGGIPTASGSGCEITHIPVAGGTTYNLTVTNTTTGCVGHAERTIVPCEPN